MITLDKVKSVLNISNNEFDSQITNLIYPSLVESLNYTNNHFPLSRLAYSGNLTITKSSSDYFITAIDNNNAFANYRVNGYITFKDSYSFNTEVFIYSKVGGLLKITEPFSVIEFTGYGSIVPIDAPLDYEVNVCLLIGYYLNKKGFYEVNESLPGGYSVSYKLKNDLLFDLFGKYRLP